MEELKKSIDEGIDYIGTVDDSGSITAHIIKIISGETEAKTDTEKRKALDLFLGGMTATSGSNYLPSANNIYKQTLILFSGLHVKCRHLQCTTDNCSSFIDRSNDYWTRLNLVDNIIESS
ncbi:hypothetical protein DFA_10289 [Cavenderia fasciculata]|uniref:Uncharacterized protein n=1 Tax=Cavenderia fasciculata TaxID=261658 RepID=F4Q9T2_CACFS|nr:uncharacterized protein DFA_10289 [Cavenderia fasciculata]EGG15451.1 hypothetical protein DFA_10289 [Cavenderia fasciculata]|eukprot:XP_004354193.1 hypothetical protein DFA_10289 [Cavenderia fasciculata]